jgi:hypothetical protein
MTQKSKMILLLSFLMLFSDFVAAEEYSILFSASVQGETEPCG